jgi:hypothetical protein
MIKKSRIFISFLPAFCLLFSSCFIFGDPTCYHYYKSFFLDDESFVIERQVFSNHELTEPTADFAEIMVKTRAVAGWEIRGKKKSGNVFEINVTTTSNGITLSKDTINRLWCQAPVLNRNDNVLM